MLIKYFLKLFIGTFDLAGSGTMDGGRVTDEIFTYDGSFDGLLSCIFVCFERKITPFDIKPEGEEGLLPALFLPSDPHKAERVRRGVVKKLGKDIFRNIKYMFLTCHPQKELIILKYLRLAFENGRKILLMLADDTVNELNGAVKHLTREAHLFKGFVRFSEYDGVLFAKIEPKNFCLPLLAAHFSDRMPKERFMIFDKTHKKALIHQSGRCEYVDIESISLDAPSGEEMMYRSMWRLFYNTVAIKQRENPVCRRSHMPKRFWGDMVEMTSDTPALDAVKEPKKLPS